MLSLGLGGLIVARTDPRTVFVIYGLVGLVAVPLALTLPRLRQSRDPAPARAKGRWTVSPLNCFYFVVALGADGVFAATLSTLLAEIIPLPSALFGAGLLLAGQRLISVILSLSSDPIVDRFEATRLLIPSGIAIATGLFAIALGYVYIGAIVVIVARAMFATVSPIIAAQQSTDRIGAIASYATWSDCGLAAGALLGILGVEWAGYPTTYGALAAMTLARHPLVQTGRADGFSDEEPMTPSSAGRL